MAYPPPYAVPYGAPPPPHAGMAYPAHMYGGMPPPMPGYAPQPPGYGTPPQPYGVPPQGPPQWGRPQ